MQIWILPNLEIPPSHGFDINCTLLIYLLNKYRPPNVWHDAEAEAPILWPPDAKSQLTEKDPYPETD